MRTDTTKQSVNPTYDITDEESPVYLPKTEAQFYQAESRQIVQVHSSMLRSVIETETVLTCFYVLPVTGQNMIEKLLFPPKKVQIISLF